MVSSMNYVSLFEKELSVSPGDFQECFVFSIHKSGSSLLYNMIREVCLMENIPAVNIPDTIFREGVKAGEWDRDPALLPLIDFGRIYYGFRFLPQILTSPAVRLKEKKSVLLVRDPRDALVSQYFSFGGRYISHKLPEKNAQNYLDKYKNTEHLDIDTYVLQAANDLLRKLTTYKTHLDFSRVLVLHYEDLYFDKFSFLAAVFAHFGFSVSEKVLNSVAEKNDVRPVKEDITKHIRKGLPGDHSEKLGKETIKTLDNIFSGIGTFYGYSLGG